MRTGFRFDPPRIDLDAETAWVFARAFGPVDRAFEDPIDGRRAVAAATTLALAARIGSRVPQKVLVGEVGQEGAGAFAEVFRNAAALAVAQEGLCSRLAEAGGALGIPTIFLKGAALQLGGWAAVGSRESCDVDVVVPVEAAERYQAGLIEKGFEEQRGVASEHQLLPVFHPSGLIVEVHTLVRGVRVGEDGRSATATELLSRGLCKPISGRPDDILIPNAGVLAAHVLVHGIGQHGLSPGSYPFTRFLADVQDLSGPEGPCDGQLGEAFGSIAEDASREEVEGVIGLVRRLADGGDPRDIAAGDDPAARLLRHAVAGALDEDYRHALKLRHYSDPVGSTTKVKTLLRNILHAFWINNSQIEVLYGRPKTGLGYLGWRLWRPFDVVVRAGRYGGAWVRHRFRR